MEKRSKIIGLIALIRSPLPDESANVLNATLLRKGGQIYSQWRPIPLRLGSACGSKAAHASRLTRTAKEKTKNYGEVAVAPIGGWLECVRPGPRLVWSNAAKFVSGIFISGSKAVYLLPSEIPRR